MKNLKEYNVLLKKLVKSVTFSQEIQTLEAKHKLNWFDINSKIRNDFIFARLLELLRVARFSEYYKDIIDIDAISNLSDYSNKVPLISRDEYRNYMDPTKDLGFPFKSYSEIWFSMISGGSTNGEPTVSRFSPTDTLSISMETAKNWIYLMNKLKVKNFWDTYPFHKLGLQASIWGNSDFNYLTGKASNLNHALGILTGFEPELINGTAYSVQRQINLLIESTKRNKNGQNFLKRIKYITYGAEFMSQSAKIQIKESLSRVHILSRYGASQAYGTIAINTPELPANEHLVMSNIAYLEVVDESGKILNDGEIGEIVLTSLHSFEQPILRFRLGDLGAIRIDDKGRQIVKLIGRTDGIAIFNSQKIPTSIIIDEACKLVKAHSSYMITGEGQIRRLVDGNYKIFIETNNIKKPKTYLNKKLDSVLKNKIFNSAKNLGLSGLRATEGYTIEIILVGVNTIARNGLSSKIRPYIDESA